MADKKKVNDSAFKWHKWAELKRKFSQSRNDLLHKEMQKVFLCYKIIVMVFIEKINSGLKIY